MTGKEAWQGVCMSPQESKFITVLGIESSCDETAVCLYKGPRKLLENQQMQQPHGGVLAEPLFSQIELHQKWGGVVPEIASRDHLRKCLSLIDTALQEAQLSKEDIDVIAYTAGPGLMGALFVGSCIGRSLAFALNKPFIPVHHMEAHLLVPMLDEPALKPPFAALLVSGGHSQFYGVKNIGDYQLMGETLDDAAGEAFDKVAKMLDLPYPGGPSLAALADQGEPAFKLPRPMCDRPGFDLSFSGLKTATLHLIEDLKAKGELEARKADLAASFQEAVVDTLFRKAKRVLKELNMKTIVLAGGVSANKRLRALFQTLEPKGYKIHYPRMKWCTDNGVMVAYAGWHAWHRGFAQHDHTVPLAVTPRWPLSDLT